MGYRLTKMEDLQNALISGLFGVFAQGFLHRTTLCIPQNHFQLFFSQKHAENDSAECIELTVPKTACKNTK